MMQSSRAFSSLTPSFNSHSSRRLTEIAARVVEEFRDEFPDEYLDEYGGSLSENDGRDFRVVEKEEDNQEEAAAAEEEEDNNDEEFEFAKVGRDFDLSPALADEIFYNGQIRPCFPLFNTDLVFGSFEGGHGNENLSSEETYQGAGGAPSPPKPSRLSLRKLFIEDREHGSLSSCSSSSEAVDDLDGLSPDSYCMWTPELAAEERQKKSNSTGSSSKRWRLRDLRRSFSNGRGNFVLLSHLNHQNGDQAKKREEKPAKVEKSSAVAPKIPIPAAAITFKKDGDQRRMTFLPYRQDLVGFVSNFSGLSKKFYPV